MITANQGHIHPPQHTLAVATTAVKFGAPHETGNHFIGAIHNGLSTQPYDNPITMPRYVFKKN